MLNFWEYMSSGSKRENVYLAFPWTAFLPPASEGWGKIIFPVCLSVHTQGVPQIQVLSQVSGSKSFSGGTPDLVGGGVPQVRGTPARTSIAPRTGYAVSGIPRAVSLRTFLLKFWLHDDSFSTQKYFHLFWVKKTAHLLSFCTDVLF